jgi:ferrous iron transport protein B
MPEISIVLVGQPNVGKSMLINSISNSKLRVGNFTGVTIDKKEIFFSKNGHDFKITDLPGTYSLIDYTIEEKVTKNYLNSNDYDIILNVIDSTNLERNLDLTARLMELNKKMIVALNMTDEATKDGIIIDEKKLTEILGVPCIKVSAVTKEGIDNLIDSFCEIYNSELADNKIKYSDVLENEILRLENYLKTNKLRFSYLEYNKTAIKLLNGELKIPSNTTNGKYNSLKSLLSECLNNIYTYYDSRDFSEIYDQEINYFAKGAAVEVSNSKFDIKTSLTQKIDSLLIHPVFGIPIFFFLIWLIFQMTFKLGAFPMSLVNSGISLLGENIGSLIYYDWVRSLVVDGIISGVGAVLSFVPNIMILFLGIALLETTGYIARVAFLLDGVFHKFGLHGKSFIPLVTGFGCSIPAYMSARTLKSEKDRMITMFIIGFMSCSARFPIYVLFIGAFFDEKQAGNVLFLIYISGAFLGLIAAKFLRVFIFKRKDDAFVMEMPKYRLPSPKLIWFVIWTKTVMYFKKAGTFILIATVIIWFASSYPVNKQLENEYAVKISQSVNDREKINFENQLTQEKLKQSYLGIVGQFTEPAFRPLGFDWKMTVALETGLAAKEIVVATLGILYSLGSETDENNQGLIKRIRQEIPFASGLAFIVFVMIYLPCLSATIVFTKETGKYRYLLYLILFTTGTAWILSFITYQVSRVFIA